MCSTSVHDVCCTRNILTIVYLDSWRFILTNDVPSHQNPNLQHPSIPTTMSARLLRPLIHSRNSSRLSAPTWSVRSLLPSPTSKETPTISASTLAHLLRLSALSPPADPASLHDHLHFVRSLQNVPTEGVAPLTAIRDEINTSRNTYRYVDIVAAEESLDKERVGDSGRVEWSPMDLPKRKWGRFFVVDEAVTEELVKPKAEEGKE